VSVLPALVAAFLLWFFRGTIAQSRFHPRCLLRLVVYPASFLPLLTLASPARIISTLFVYASRPNADWATVFWWLTPDGRWSLHVYARMFGVDWFRSSIDWSHPLRLLTLVAITASCTPLVLPNLRVARLTRTLGLLVLILLWPATMVYVAWLVSLTVGAQRYLTTQRGWVIGLTSGGIGLLCLLVADTLLGEGVLFDIVLAWP
jgi:hypothetical protein